MAKGQKISVCGVKRSDRRSTDHVLQVATGHLVALGIVSTTIVNQFLSKRGLYCSPVCQCGVDSEAYGTASSFEQTV